MIFEMFETRLSGLILQTLIYSDLGLNYQSNWLHQAEQELYSGSGSLYSERRTMSREKLDLAADSHYEMLQWRVHLESADPYPHLEAADLQLCLALGERKHRDLF